MQNEFEKEVRQKLEELRLPPSPPVWEEVAWQIRPERKRRRVFFWFLLIAGIMAGGTGIYMGMEKKGPVTAETLKPSGKHSSPAQQNQQKQSATNGEKTSPLIEESSGTSTKTSSPESITNSITTASTQKRLNKVVQSKSTTLSPISVSPNNSLNISPSIIINGSPDVTQSIIIPWRNDKVSTALASPFINPMPADASQSQAMLQTIAAAITNTKTKTDSLQKATSDSVTKIVRNSKGRWRKMVTIDVGASGYASSPLGILSAEKLFQMDVMPQFNTGAGTPVSSPQLVAALATRRGVAFSISGGVWKNISRRTELSIGVAYSLYTTRQPVGSRVRNDTVVRYSGNQVALESFYSTGDSSITTNHFHTLSLPVAISWQVHQRLPFFASFNIAYGRLVSANALVYSASSNLYFEGDDGYNKHQLPVTIGLSYRFSVGRANTLSVGPIAAYNLLRLNNETTGEAQHLTFVGIQSSLRF